MFALAINFYYFIPIIIVCAPPHANLYFFMCKVSVIVNCAFPESYDIIGCHW